VLCGEGVGTRLDVGEPEGDEANVRASSNRTCVGVMGEYGIWELL
jgi:hypothetical protein